VALAPKTFANQPGLLYEAHNYPAAGTIADMVFLMTYEWGYTHKQLRYTQFIPAYAGLIDTAMQMIAQCIGSSPHARG